ncbi:hypothetical protein J2Z77_002887 [Streptomyces avidinii]|uniref:Uncharacterized protein n=1 Tax=Streptomyces avidinii TaxID=1895 RepID=A0ABS4L4R4_STRAV|nr:hypothetical protein [Streptomyces avidinii]
MSRTSEMHQMSISTPGALAAGAAPAPAARRRGA